MKRAFASLILIAAFAAADARAQQAPGAGANYETRLSTLEDQMRNMNGQIEQLNYGLRRLDQTLTRAQEDYEARMAKLEAAAAAPPPAAVQPPPAATQPPPASTNVPVPPSQTAAPVNGTLGALKVQQDGRVTGGTVAPQAPPLPDTPADYGLTPQEQYDRAFALLRQANYDEADKAFKSFIDKNPKDKLIDNAKYWYAETLYVRSRFAEAAVAFADAYQQNTKGSKAADSLLKLAMSLDATGKTQDACTALGELKASYPNAPASVRQRASEERTKLKCASAP